MLSAFILTESEISNTDPSKAFLLEWFVIVKLEIVKLVVVIFKIGPTELEKNIFKMKVGYDESKEKKPFTLVQFYIFKLVMFKASILAKLNT